MSIAVVVAAGAGRRLGGVAKALLRLTDGRTYLTAIRDTALAAGIDSLVVVVGPPHERVTRDEARRLGLRCVTNPDPARGMASSVALGFAHCVEQFVEHDTDGDDGGEGDGGTRVRAGLLWPVDHPLVSPASVRGVLERVREHAAVIPVYRGRGGHPSAFAPEVWPALAACMDAPMGARSVIRELAAQRTAGERGSLVRFEVEDPGVVADVDTHAQRAALESPRGSLSGLSGQVGEVTPV